MAEPSIFERARFKYLPTLLRPFLPIRRRGDVEKLGTAYGGWMVPTSVLSAESVCYCVGVGEDNSFDLALIDRFGCHVWAYDPTPRAIAHVGRTAAGNDHYHFAPVGLWSADAVMRFYAPAKAKNVSHSLTNIQRTDQYIEVPVRSLATLMRDNGHARVDLLKIDIEGAEYDVLAEMMRLGVRPTVLCVDFDQPTPVRKTLAMIRRLREYGYELVAHEVWDYTFLAPPPPAG